MFNTAPKKFKLAIPDVDKSVRLRLLLVALLPILLVSPLLMGFSIYRWSGQFDNLLISKVNGDLTIARQYLNRILENSGEKIQAVGASANFVDVVKNNVDNELSFFLQKSRNKLEFDFLYIVKEKGEIISSASKTKSERIPKIWSVIQKALKGQSATSIDIYNQKQLSFLSPELANQATVKLIPTKAAVPTNRKMETRGMMVQTATPVTINGEKAALVGGILLNRNLDFIDTINALVYQQASLPFGSQGTTTLFLDDVRVSTNVRLFENKRALGTRVSAIVRETVLDKGKIWLDRAFVVNDWYISAYEPIIDSYGKRVGMLYVGFLDKPFQTEKYTTLFILVAIFLVVTLISVPIFLYWVRGIFKPLERMVSTILDVEEGNMSARTGPVESRDEIGKVANHLDELLDLLQQRDKQLRNWAEELNKRVEERTAELQATNKQLESTTKQLVISEKLAAIGEITAGVAHEINNPVAVIQGNMDVIREVLGEETNQVITEFRLIDEQVHSINLIVSKLLQFARPEEFAGYHDQHMVDDVMTDCLLLVQHLLNKTLIKVERNSNSENPVLINRTEFQQVLINLIVNAIHSMEDGGTLTLNCKDKVEGEIPGVLIEISDTGKGMSPDVLKRVFDPFFTTKQSEGTGLGLSISQTLISRMRGHINVKSVLGRGTTFSVWLPAAVEEASLSINS